MLLQHDDCVLHLLEAGGGSLLNKEIFSCHSCCQCMGKGWVFVMERRWTERTLINVPVDLSYAGMQSGEYRTRDIGLGGVFVELPKEVTLAEETPVELTFKLGRGDNLTKHRINARVVRVSRDGVGMMFRDFDAIAFRSLQEVLLYNQNPMIN